MPTYRRKRAPFTEIDFVLDVILSRDYKESAYRGKTEECGAYALFYNIGDGTIRIFVGVAEWYQDENSERQRCITIPGGHAENGEIGPAETITREFREETGIEYDFSKCVPKLMQIHFRCERSPEEYKRFIYQVECSREMLDSMVEICTAARIECDRGSLNKFESELVDCGILEFEISRLEKYNWRRESKFKFVDVRGDYHDQKQEHTLSKNTRRVILALFRDLRLIH